MAEPIANNVTAAPLERGLMGSETYITGFAVGLYPSAGEYPLRNALAHGGHAGCCITAAFHKVVQVASVATLVVDSDGFVIYANPPAQALLGYSLEKLTQSHITELVEAEASWVASEFSYLATRQAWNGRVLLRQMSGTLQRVSVNAFTNDVPGGAAEHVAFLHPIEHEDGPAISRLPDLATQAGITVRQLALLELLSEGFVDKDIASILGAPVWLVNKEIDSLVNELGALSRTEACVLAMQRGLIV